MSRTVRRSGSYPSTEGPAPSAHVTRAPSGDGIGDHLGVRRQVDDCERLVERKGWEVAERYVDDDVSAYKGRVRPAYRRMLDDDGVDLR